MARFLNAHQKRATYGRWRSMALRVRRHPFLRASYLTFTSCFLDSLLRACLLYIKRLWPATTTKTQVSGNMKTAGGRRGASRAWAALLRGRPCGRCAFCASGRPCQPPARCLHWAGRSWRRCVLAVARTPHGERYLSQPISRLAVGGTRDSPLGATVALFEAARTPSGTCAAPLRHYLYLFTLLWPRPSLPASPALACALELCGGTFCGPGVPARPTGLFPLPPVFEQTLLTCAMLLLLLRGGSCLAWRLQLSRLYRRHAANLAAWVCGAAWRCCCLLISYCA